MAGAAITPASSQNANHIFEQLQIREREDYGIIEYIDVELKVLTTVQHQVYLFICPPADFRIGPSSFRLPECPAYWSINPLGVPRLSVVDAPLLGLPIVQLTTHIYTRSWPGPVYTGLRQFHQGKGFVPDSLTVAQHLGHPLYQVSIEKEGSFVYVDDEISDAEDTPGIPFLNASKVLHSLSWAWRIMEPLKFGLIVVLAIALLYESARRAG
ncbi:hypothetical protein DFH07DRAFT_93204 [Mycena maculata]|uniref:Uncharacterized protein n=1 Tax=Mycena maculata TaxID=230809 RepID=A0AAD7MYI4_9AGAR|nr:hypothetical protein DFH07DRAFT_93204 [Mycena maculata]